MKRNKARREAYQQKTADQRVTDFNEGIQGAGLNRFQLKAVATHPPVNGVKTTDVQGLLVDEGFYDKRQVAGKLMRSRITSDTPKELGFATEDQAYRNIGSSSLGSHEALARQISKRLTAEQEHSLIIYANYGFDWIADSFHNKNGGAAVEDATIDLSVHPEVYDSWEIDGDIPDELKTSANILKLTAALDEAISSARSYQKTVYRGTSRMFKGITTGSAKEYVDSKLGVGETVSFDGYMSASYSFDVSERFAYDSKVIFEIKTPEGLNTANLSDYNDEFEVLLPRSSKYMVVGQREADISGNKYTVVQMVAVDGNSSILT